MIMGSDQWNPRLFMKPLAAPSKLTYKKGTLQWKPVEGAQGYIVVDEAGKIVAITSQCHLTIDSKSQSYYVRAVNEFGHLGECKIIRI